MDREQRSLASQGRLPVFIFPTSLTFYVDDHSSHRQVLQLYNMYDFMISFKVLCTAPRKYSVIQPEGVVKSRSCVDIIVSLRDMRPQGEGRQDKFRVQISEHGQKAVIGKSYIPSVLISTREASEEPYESLSITPGPAQLPWQRGLQQQTPSVHASRGSDWLLMLLLMCCAFIMCAPLQLPQPSTNIWLPQYMAVTIECKYVACLILGAGCYHIIKNSS